ncbi:MAG: hypothetical protein KJN97_13465 [Deltaproteobacteria bacterium]|nr:hypothetical protein [Deltaproteobacteria bacterium]
MTLGRLGLLALIAAGLSFLIFSPGPRYERHGLAKDFVERTVGVNAVAAHERLAYGLEEELVSHASLGRFGSGVVEHQGHGFPTIRMMNFHLENNVGLARYALLGDEAWTQDFFVKGPYRPWVSECLDGAKPVPLSTDFLIHLEPIADDRIRIEVIEYAPKVTVGTNFRLCGRHLLPEVTPDTRPVAPPTKDRQEMLDLVVRVVERERPKAGRNGAMDTQAR